MHDYKTVKNLGQAWSDIDEALFNIEIATNYLQSIKLKEDGLLGLKDLLQGFDEYHLTSVKNGIEELIIKKKDHTNYFKYF